MKMRGLVIVKINGLDHYLIKTNALLFHHQQLVGFIFIAFAVDLSHERQMLKGNGTKSGLGIAYFYSAGQPENRLGQVVAEPPYRPVLPFCWRSA